MSEYYITSRDHGFWEKAKAKTLAGAKWETSERVKYMHLD